MRYSTVESSTGIGLPSAVDGTRLVGDGLGWMERLKEMGRELLAPLRGSVVDDDERGDSSDEG